MLHDSKVGCFACIAICRSHVLICTSFSSCSLFLELHHAGHAPAQRQAVLLRRCVWLVCAGLRMGFRGQCSGFWGQSWHMPAKRVEPIFLHAYPGTSGLCSSPRTLHTTSAPDFQISSDVLRGRSLGGCSGNFRYTRTPYTLAE